MNEKISTLIQIEQSQKNIWFIVSFIAGIIGYFSLFNEPDWWIGPVCFVFFGLCWFLGRRDLGAHILFGLCFFAAFGFSVVYFKAHFVQAPVLKEPLFDYQVTGIIQQADLFHDKQQIVLAHPEIESLSPDETPKFIRLNIPEKEPVLQVGDRVTFSAHLTAPATPAVAGGFNAARALWFKQIGAVGRAASPVLILERPEKAPDKIEHIRQRITEKITSHLAQPQAGIATALITGNQGMIPTDAYQLYVRSGIAHVLSVSGLHLTLLAGFVFLVLRFLLGAVPGIALRIHPKKVSAVITLSVTFLYLLISGCSVPALRSFIMIAVVLIGTLFDRNALSLWTVAMTAFFILLFWPESVLSASFQLSFMAVIALVALYRLCQQHLPERTGFLSGIFVFVMGLIAVNVIAGAATTPYTIYHFNQSSNYGLLTNLLTTTLFSVCIMPALFGAALLMPAGCEGILLDGAGWGLKIIEKICIFVSDLPGAFSIVPAMPVSGLCMISFGIFVLCICQSRIRWSGFIFILIGIGSYFYMQMPDVIVSGQGKVFAVRENGVYRLSSMDYPFTSNPWLLQNGQNPATFNLPIWTEDQVTINGHLISFTSWNCQAAELTFALDRHVGFCPGITITKQALRETGTVFVFAHGEKLVLKSIEDFLGNRPWHPKKTLEKNSKNH